jgi:SAM-dependent methyltransferase
MLAPRKVLHSTPPYVLAAAFELAELRPTDLLLDVGCGDGRALVAAAREIGSRGIGWEINPDRSAEATEAVSGAGLGDRVAIHTGNVLSDAEPQLWELFGAVLRGEAPPREALAPAGVGCRAECDGLVVLLYLTEYGVRKLLPLLLEAAAARDPALGPIRVLSYVYPFPRECGRGSAPPERKQWCADPENLDRSFPLFFYAFHPPMPAAEGDGKPPLIVATAAPPEPAPAGSVASAAAAGVDSTVGCCSCCGGGDGGPGGLVATVAAGCVLVLLLSARRVAAR